MPNLKTYSGFGPWQNIALRLIHDDLPLTNIFFQVQGDSRFRPFHWSLIDAACHIVHDRKEKVTVVPCLALLVHPATSRMFTHATLLVCDGRQVRLFDPNGRYPNGSLAYFLRGYAVSSDQVAEVLKSVSKSTLPWSRSRTGIQATIKHNKDTAFIPNRGYCMFICRALIDYLRHNAEKGTNSNIVHLTRTYERMHCPSPEIGHLALAILMRLWPNPDEAEILSCK